MSAKILIVDDSLTVRMDLDEAFRSAGFHTLPCGSIAEAKETLGRERIDVAILDVVLPDGDGVELLSELRTLTADRHVVVLMLSSEVEVGDRVRGLTKGADEYVGKPYDRGYVVARARELLQLQQKIRADRPILLIDDSATFRAVLAHALEEDGYRVSLASSGEEGLRMAAVERPEAIIVDGVLPGMDGSTVIRHVRLDAALRRVVCLLLTDTDEMDAERRALDAGADAFVNKREDAAVLLAKLRAVLRMASVTRSDDETRSLLAPSRILAVDDSATYRDALGTALRAEGYDVIQVASGEEALEILSIQTVDCVLLDLVMPGIGGTETCRRIKSSPVVRDIPVIVLTSLDDRTAMLETLGTGADDYIQKSAELDVLKARVRAQLRRRQFEDETRRVRERLLRSEIDAAESRRAREIADMRGALVEKLEAKNRELPRARGQAPEPSPISTRVSGGASACASASSRCSRSWATAPASASRFQTSFGSPDLVDCYPSLLNQAVMNLIANSMDAISGAGTIAITTGAVEGAYQISVRDTGTGIPPELRERVLEPFFTTKAVGEGTGLGLAITYSIVKHGGTLKDHLPRGRRYDGDLAHPIPQQRLRGSGEPPAPA